MSLRGAAPDALFAVSWRTCLPNLNADTCSVSLLYHSGLSFLISSAASFSFVVCALLWALLRLLFHKCGCRAFVAAKCLWLPSVCGCQVFVAAECLWLPSVCGCRVFVAAECLWLPSVCGCRGFVAARHIEILSQFWNIIDPGETGEASREMLKEVYRLLKVPLTRARDHHSPLMGGVVLWVCSGALSSTPQSSLLVYTTDSLLVCGWCSSFSLSFLWVNTRVMIDQ